MAYDNIKLGAVGSVYQKTDGNDAIAVWIKGFPNIVFVATHYAGAAGSATAFVFTPRY